MMEAPEAVTESDEEDWTDVVTKDVSMTTSDGTPILTVSIRSGSWKLMCQRRRTPCFLREGSWTSTWIATPTGLPRARITSASWGLVGARKA